MKRLVVITLAMVCFIAAKAGKFNYTFHNTPISRALESLSCDNPDINIAFIYKELDSYRTSANVNCDDVYTALREIVGLNPVSIAERRGSYYVEALQHGRYSFRGRIVTTDGEPLPAATVMLIAAKDSTVVTYGISGEDGAFSIPCDKKNVIAKVSYLGYITRYKRPQEFSFGTITMQEKPIALKSVSVEGQSTILSPDKNTYIPSGRQKQFSQTGFDLLRHLAIPTLIVAPGSDAVTDLFGTVCNLFINFTPASRDDMNAINLADVRKVEVYDSPADPRFRGAQKAVNIIVHTYKYGGYTKLMASETVLNGFSNKANIYSKFAYKSMTYDLYLGFNNNSSNHTGNDMRSEYTLANTPIAKDERTAESKSVGKDLPVTLRALYKSQRLQIQNLASFIHESGPEKSQVGTIEYSSIPEVKYDYSRTNRAQTNSMKYNGSVYWVHPSDFAVDYSHSVDYDHRRIISDYENDAVEECIFNNASENRTHVKANLNVLKAFGSKHRIKFGGQFIYLNDDVIYHNSTDYNDNLRQFAAGGSAQYVFSSRDVNFSAIFGAGYERTNVNETSQNDVSPYGNVNFSWRFNAENRISAYASLGVWSPDIDVRQDAIVRSDEFMYFTGNPDLKNYKELNANVTYNFVPSNVLSLAAFSGYDVSHDRVATVYYQYDGDKAILRSFVNNGDY